MTGRTSTASARPCASRSTTGWWPRRPIRRRMRRRGAAGRSGADDLVSVSCPSTTFCDAVTADGATAFSTDPGSATAMWFPRQAPVPPAPATGSVQAIACASSSLCIFGDRMATIFATTNPANDLPTWTNTPIGGAALTDVACPAPTLCIAAAEDLKTASSANAGAASPVWSTPAASGICELNCLSTTFCIGFDTGAVATSTSPPAAWGAPVPIGTAAGPHRRVVRAHPDGVRGGGHGRPGDARRRRAGELGSADGRRHGGGRPDADGDRGDVVGGAGAYVSVDALRRWRQRLRGDRRCDRGDVRGRGRRRDAYAAGAGDGDERRWDGEGRLGGDRGGADASGAGRRAVGAAGPGPSARRRPARRRRQRSISTSSSGGCAGRWRPPARRRSSPTCVRARGSPARSRRCRPGG